MLPMQLVVSFRRFSGHAIVEMYRSAASGQRLGDRVLALPGARGVRAPAGEVGAGWRLRSLDSAVCAMMLGAREVLPPWQGASDCEDWQGICCLCLSAFSRLLKTCHCMYNGSPTYHATTLCISSGICALKRAGGEHQNPSKTSGTYCLRTQVLRNCTVCAICTRQNS